MKLIKSIASALLILLTSCGFFTEEDFGYPKQITFTNDGGMTTITSDSAKGFTHASIQNSKTGDHGSLIPSDDERYSEDLEQSELDWLKIEYGSNGHNRELKIFAEPNSSGKERTLHIELISAYEYQVVKVVQSK